MKSSIKNIVNKKTEFDIDWDNLITLTKPQLQRICSILHMKYENNTNKEQLVNLIASKVK